MLNAESVVQECAERVFGRGFGDSGKAGLLRVIRCRQCGLSDEMIAGAHEGGFPFQGRCLVDFRGESSDCRGAEVSSKLRGIRRKSYAQSISDAFPRICHSMPFVKAST